MYSVEFHVQPGDGDGTKSMLEIIFNQTLKSMQYTFSFTNKGVHIFIIRLRKEEFYLWIFILQLSKKQWE